MSDVGAAAFAPAFVTGAAAVALWADARFAWLAPRSLGRRVAAAVIAAGLLSLAPVSNASSLAVYGSLFGALFPTLVLTFLATLWLLRALREVATGG